MQGLGVDEVLTRYGPVVFAELTRVFNFLFEFRNEGYQAVDQQWLEDTLTIGDVTELGREVARQNRLEWLLPFFRKSIAAELAKI